MATHYVHFWKISLHSRAIISSVEGGLCDDELISNREEMENVNYLERAVLSMGIAFTLQLALEKRKITRADSLRYF